MVKAKSSAKKSSLKASNSFQSKKSSKKVSSSPLAVASASNGDITYQTSWLSSLITDEAWKTLLKDIFSKAYFIQLEKALAAEMATKQIFPPRKLIFNALRLTPLKSVKVVILGQDPYHDDDQAHGLAFSVPKGIKCPPSLKNIYKELETDCPGFKTPPHGCLDSWAQQGVLMLNAFLTVEAHKAGSHSKLGWEKFTNDLLASLSANSTGVAFVFWGKFAAKKAELIASDREHLCLIGGHPSPLSVKLFLGCRHFSKINAHLTKRGQNPINWQVPIPPFFPVQVKS